MCEACTQERKAKEAEEAKRRQGAQRLPSTLDDLEDDFFTPVQLVVPRPEPPKSEPAKADKQDAGKADAKVCAISLSRTAPRASASLQLC